MILRPGGITLEMLESVVGKVDTDAALELKGNVKPRSPGMKYRHYSPKAEMILVYGSQDDVVAKINELSAENRKKGIKTGVLSSLENAQKYCADTVIVTGSVDNLAQVASGLFDSLRKFDEENVDIIYSETFPERGIGRAIIISLKRHQQSNKETEMKKNIVLFIPEIHAESIAESLFKDIIGRRGVHRWFSSERISLQETRQSPAIEVMKGIQDRLETA